MSCREQQNACVECYNRTVRHEWLDQYIIESIEEAQEIRYSGCEHQQGQVSVPPTGSSLIREQCLQLRRPDLNRELVERAVKAEWHFIVLVVHRGAGVDADIE